MLLCCRLIGKSPSLFRSYGGRYARLLNQCHASDGSGMWRNGKLEIEQPQNVDLSRTKNAVRFLHHKRELHCTSCKMSKNTNVNDHKDATIPFLQSNAHKFRVDDAYTVDTPKDRSRQKFALPLGGSIFAIIIYYSFIRGYGSKDKSIVGFLTQDISDKLPHDVREQIYSDVNQTSVPTQTVTSGNDK